MKNEIKCPHCGATFNLDEAAFAEILKQVRDAEFNAELHSRIDEAVKLAIAETKNKVSAEAAQKDAEIAQLKIAKESEVQLAQARTQQELQSEITKRDTSIAELQAKMQSAETEKQLALQSSTTELIRQRDDLTAKLDASKTERELAVNRAVTDLEKEKDRLASELKSKDQEQKILETSLKERYDRELKLKDEQIAQYRDFKAKQSVKLLGESLEQHCEILFRQWQATGAFRNVQFSKDSDIRSGAKGDYIYREMDESGNEILSIMFEMKNEADDSSTKKKNEDHLKKLHTDRKEKNCQYAVLVSMLEADSELYTGITDVSYTYEKMYVIRPQFFIPLITILRNGALDSVKYRAELALVRNQNIDITNFEHELQLFQDGFMKNVKDSSNKFKEAMDGIDVTIKKLESIKEALRLSNKHLMTAGSKVENVSVKRLTKHNPTMATKFDELRRPDKDVPRLPIG